MEKVVKEFHKYFYDNWEHASWLGHRCIQYPTDMILLQEIIHKNRPDFIIETGTNAGGSALFYASIMSMIDNGNVITIDKGIPLNMDELKNNPMSDRIIFIKSNSVNHQLIDILKDHIKDSSCMVILDSLHSKGHVLKEINMYKDFVTEGQYMIVQDTDLGGNPVWPEYGEGPMGAVKEFLNINNEFEVDRGMENRFFLTCSPNGFLRKK